MPHVVDTPTGHKGLGAYPSLPDLRDWHHNFAGAKVADTVDLRTTGFLPDVWDQGDLGSCVAHGTLAAYSFDLAMQGGARNYDPSRLFLYYNGRVLENTVREDSGLTVSDGIKALAGQGAPPSTDWPYVTSRFTNKPPAVAYTDGLERQAIKYAKVAQTTAAMQACLTAGTPIVVGFTVYSSFESDAVAGDGIVPMPSSREQVLGGHCVLVVGYKQIGSQPYWICRNSWGTGWGDSGFFYMPQTYFTSPQLASDFWTVQSVESPDPAPVPPKPDPTPTPAPVPETVTAADKALNVALGSWPAARHVGAAKTIADALTKWRAAKSLKA